MAQFKGWTLAVMATFVLSACAGSGTDPTGDQYAGSATDATGDDGGGDGSGSGSGSGGGSGSSDTGGDATGAQGMMLATGCAAYGSDIYTPFAAMGPVSSGNVATFPWRGKSSTYPDTIEDFRGDSLPTQVECGSNKSVRDHLDVTAGCLSAISNNGQAVGQVHMTSDGYYRSFALPYDPVNNRQVAWTDMAVEYRFYYSQWTGDVSNPGFKAFARYLTEYDLYVGSWRRDGVVQIQKKQCGEYTILKRDPNWGPPAPNMWHTIRFEVVGNEQRLYLDGRLAMTTTDDSIKRGTAGIRIDDAEGALIDDWHVTAP
jgi:hypothetical protein